MSQLRSQVISTGSFVPERVVTNHELETMLDTSDEWISQRCGIKQRHWAEPSTTTTDLSYQASLLALEKAGLEASALDMIIVATVTPDHEFPGSACFLQERLEVRGIPAIDVRQQCSGFVYGLSMADLYIKSGRYKRVLLVCSELHSKCLDLSPRGRNVSILFGDGAAAVILEAREVEDPQTESFVYDTSIFSDGTQARQLWCQAPGTGMNSKQRVEENMLLEGLQFPYMNGKAIFAHAVRTMSQCLLDCLKQNELNLEDLDLLFFHQANLRICEAIQKQLNVEPKKVYNTIREYGNTTSATIPLGLDHAVRAGVLRPGMLIATVAFGSGFTWGAGLIRW